MNETYTTFDTFTVGELAAPNQVTTQVAERQTSNSSQATATENAPAPRNREPAVIARFPRIDSKHATAKPHVRVKKPAFAEPTPQVTRQTAPVKPAAVPTAEPTTTLPASWEIEERVDPAASPLHRHHPEPSTTPFTEYSAASTTVPKAPQTATPTAASPKIHQPTDEANELANLSDSWLVRLEAAVVPYSRWIVLAAIFAALGLSFVLLQGAANTPSFDNQQAAPLAEHQAATSELTELESGAVAEIVELPPALPVVMQAEATVRASGPNGMPRSAHQSPHRDYQGASHEALATHQTLTEISAPQAKLTGTVVPIEPYRVARSNQPAATVNTVIDTGIGENIMPANYPRTADNRSDWTNASNRSTTR